MDPKGWRAYSCIHTHPIPPDLMFRVLTPASPPPWEHFEFSRSSSPWQSRGCPPENSRYFTVFFTANAPWFNFDTQVPRHLDRRTYKYCMDLGCIL